MILGACYNVFDAEELLERSIVSIKPNVDFVCVVYQVVSNFGNQHPNPFITEFLESLKSKGLVDELILYTPRLFSEEEKQNLVSSRASPQHLGGPPETVADQFFNELTKRELGRQACLRHGCTHFMNMDTDEFYKVDELRAAKRLILEHNYDATACRMRLYFKEPIYEYFPFDNVNAVPLIFKLAPNNPLRLAAPYPVLLDPTRRCEYYQRFHLFERSDIEMHHYTFVRKNMQTKLLNVSNKANYDQDIAEFLKKFEAWTGPECGVLHPHPYLGRLFTTINTTENFFDIDLTRMCALCCNSDTKRCSRCKKTRYCSRRCQQLDWEAHKKQCIPTS